MSPAVHRVPRHSPFALVLVSAIGLAACSATSTATQAATTLATASTSEAPSSEPASAPASASVAPGGSPSEAPSSSAEASAAPAESGPTAVPTAIDPSQLITAQEAGALAGTTFGPAKCKTLPSNAKMCTYGGQTKDVFDVVVAVAPDEATAKKQEAAAEADLQASASQAQQGMTVTKLPNFAPNTDAVLMELKPNSLGIAGAALYLLKGTSFAGFSDLTFGGKAPSADAMKAEAMKVLAQLP